MDQIFDEATWGKVGKDIVPSVFYQVYRVSGAWNSDDESLWYVFEPGMEESEISILVSPEVLYTEDEIVTISGKTYVKDSVNMSGETPALWGDGAEGHDIEKAVGDVKTPAKYAEKVAATRKWAGSGVGEEINVVLTASDPLKASYPYAHVIVDGKEHDLAYLNNPISLVMDKDHRIIIEWSSDLKETFRIVINR